MAPKLMILAGAPQSSALDWGSPQLLTSFQEPIVRFFNLSGQTHGSSLPSRQESSEQDHATWRSLALTRQLHSVGDRPDPADFFTTAAISLDPSQEGGEELLSQFYEHSLALHEETTVDPGPESSGEATDSIPPTDDSFSQDVVADQGLPPPPPPPPPVGAIAAAHLSDLEDIPPARYILSVLPRKVTVAIIAGVISISPPREVRTRLGAALSLVEVLLGDETRAGFALTFWLSSAHAAATVSKLRLQDVVLVQNVALSVFMGKVYGQSMRSGVTRVLLLYRRKLGRDDVGGHYSLGDVAGTGGAHPQLEKTRRVRDWVLRFVGGDAPEGRASKLRSWEKPPEDSR